VERQWLTLGIRTPGTRDGDRLPHDAVVGRDPSHRLLVRWRFRRASTSEATHEHRRAASQEVHRGRAVAHRPALILFVWTGWPPFVAPAASEAQDNSRDHEPPAISRGIGDPPQQVPGGRRMGPGLEGSHLVRVVHGEGLRFRALRSACRVGGPGRNARGVTNIGVPSIPSSVEIWASWRERVHVSVGSDTVGEDETGRPRGGRRRQPRRSRRGSNRSSRPRYSVTGRRPINSGSVSRTRLQSRADARVGLHMDPSVYHPSHAEEVRNANIVPERCGHQLTSSPPQTAPAADVPLSSSVQR